MNEEIDNIEFDGVDFSDYPDFCDAFICCAERYAERYAERNGEPLNDTELEKLNEDSDFLYNKLMDHLL